MRVGIIDLGTNTFNLLIAEVNEKGNYKRLYNSKVPVKLGEGGIHRGMITEDAIQRALVALESQIGKVQSLYCDRILAFATSAVRSAENGAEFVKEVKDRFGISIKVIDGNQEAGYIFQGVQLAGALREGETSLILDIGGGSTEFIIADSEEILWKHSFELGVSRMMERFQPGDPLSPEEILNIRQFLLKEIDPVFLALEENPAKVLIGSSGSFDSLAEMIAIKFHGQESPVDHITYDFNLAEFQKLYEMLLISTKEERMQMPGLPKMRVDMIVLASIFVDLILKKTRMQQMRLSSYSLKEGVLFDVLKGNL